MIGFAAPRRDYTAGTRVPVCGNCGARKMILHRVDHADRTTGYYLKCADCDRITRTVPTMKAICELCEWVPIGAMVEA